MAQKICFLTKKLIPTVLFSVFRVILGDIDLKIFFKKSKTSCTVFFWDALQHITRKKKKKNSEGHG